MPDESYVVVDPKTKRRKVVSAKEAADIHAQERKARDDLIAKEEQAKKRSPAPPPRQAEQGGE